jgi:hypothetical protein
VNQFRLKPASPAALVIGVILMGCGSLEPSEPALPPLAVRIEPPVSYHQWFAATTACSGLDGTPEVVEWYVVPGAASFRVEGADRVGMWQRVNGRSQIVIAGAYQNHEMVVRHEILHHLLGQAGHPPELFEERCPLTWERWNQQLARASTSH